VILRALYRTPIFINPTENNVIAQIKIPLPNPEYTVYQVYTFNSKKKNTITTVRQFLLDGELQFYKYPDVIETDDPREFILNLIKNGDIDDKIVI
jgi:hypothetical protein